MPKLSPQRRIAGALAGLAGAITVFLPANFFAHQPHLLYTAHFLRGLMVGLSLGISMTILIRGRRACSPSNSQDVGAS